jgi:trehalose-6-phosphate synthase
MLVLSEHAGTAEAFPDVVSVNPFDIDATASAIESVLDTDSVTASATMRRMREQVRTNDLEWWIGERINASRNLLTRETRVEPKALSAGGSRHRRCGVV